ncbi:MAG: hypothetical protein J6Y55_09755 [Bacteroidales bacterium]|nr:hypothetical protein [Bacteroidales bacterium]
MNKLFLILFLCIASHVAVAQEVYDTVLFDNITFNDSKLFTNHSHIEKYFDIMQSRARVHTYSTFPAPFKHLFPHDSITIDTILFYEIWSHDLYFFYAERYPDSILVSGMLSKDKVIKITKNDSTINLTERTNLSEVSKFFRLSSMFLHDEWIADFRYGKEMCLIVKKDEDYVYCYLVFDDKDKFYAMHLYAPNLLTY